MADVVIAPGTHLYFNFKDGFCVGNRVLIAGVTGASKFEINFNTAEYKALHINPRQQESRVVMNSDVGGKWGEEEAVEWPYKWGEEFKVAVHCLDGEYQVMIVMGGDTHSYAQRVPACDVLNMQIEGDVNIKEIQITN